MKAKAKSLEECSTLFEIEVPKDTVEKALDEVYEEITKVSNIPGFRTGKAPKEIVKKHYTRNANEEVLKRLIPEAYRFALAEHKISPVGMPEISEVSFEEGKGLSFKAKVETHPKFRLKDYKGIKVEKKRIEVKDDDVDKALENLRELNAKYIAVEDRAVQLGDYTVVDLEGFVDGKPLHKKRQGLWLSIEKNGFIPGLSEKMIGMTRREERDIDVTLPAPLNQTKDNAQRGPAMNSIKSDIGGKKYPEKAVAGKPAKYHVKVKEIKLRKLPNLDDEFAKDLGKDNLEGLKKEIREELERRAKQNIEIDIENQILKKLMDENIFKVPASLVKRQLDLMVENAKRRLGEKGFKREELDKKDDEFKEKFKDDASRQIRLMFILDDIAHNENIDVNTEDLEEAYKGIAAQSGESAAKVKDYYKKEDLIDSLKEKAREEKTIRFLLDNAQVIKEKD